jgi:hypothetical protein
MTSNKVSMTEPDVTLTDFFLALESACFGFIVWRNIKSPDPLKSWLLVYFASICLASLCGGLVHGFYLSPGLGHSFFWPMTLLAVGVSALATAAMGAVLLFSPPAARHMIVVFSLVLGGYCLAILLGIHKFVVAVAITLPAALFLLTALAIVYFRGRRPGAILAMAGIVMTLVAALAQQLGLGIHPLNFNHNATAHVVQALALGLIFIGGARLGKQSGDPVVQGDDNAIAARIP